jgi:hypothetical protein
MAHTQRIGLGGAGRAGWGTVPGWGELIRMGNICREFRFHFFARKKIPVTLFLSLWNGHPGKRERHTLRALSHPSAHPPACEAHVNNDVNMEVDAVYSTGWCCVIGGAPSKTA